MEERRGSHDCNRGSKDKFWNRLRQTFTLELTAYKTKKHPDVNFQLKLGVQQLTSKLTTEPPDKHPERAIAVGLEKNNPRNFLDPDYRQIPSQEFDNDNEDTMVTVCGCPFVPQDR